MDKKYFKFYQNFHKAFDGKSNHCSKTIGYCGIILGVTVMKKKKEKTKEKKLEGVVVKPEDSRDLIMKNLMEMFKKQGIKVKKG